MKAILLTLLLFLGIIYFLIISFKRFKADMLTAEELEYLRFKYIIEHKDQFPKRVV